MSFFIKKKELKSCDLKSPKDCKAYETLKSKKSGLKCVQVD